MMAVGIIQVGPSKLAMYFYISQSSIVFRGIFFLFYRADHQMSSITEKYC